MKYNLILKNGETREIKFLDRPLFPCLIEGEGNVKYKTMQEIASTRSITCIDTEDPHYLFQDYIGVIRNEGTMFDIYRALRNPIVKLELDTEELPFL